MTKRRNWALFLSVVALSAVTACGPVQVTANPAASPYPTPSATATPTATPTTAAPPAVAVAPVTVKPTTKAPVKPVPAPPKPAPPKPPAPPAPVAGVHPGAFCSPKGARGTTSTGVAMECKPSATDSRNRWRAA